MGSGRFADREDIKAQSKQGLMVQNVPAIENKSR
jgi:hypothetical protein